MKFKPLLRLFKLAPKLKIWAWLAGIILIFEAVSAPVVGELIRRMTDALFTPGYTGFQGFIWATVALVATFTVLAWVRTRILARISEQGAGELRRLAGESLLEIPLARLEAMHTGDLLSRLTNDTGLIRYYLYFDLFWFIAAPLAGILSLIYVFYLDWALTLATLGMMPILIFLSTKASRPVEKLSGRLQENLAALSSSTQDALGGSAVVKAFNLQEELDGSHGRVLARTRVSGLALARQQVWVRICATTTGFLPFFLPLALGGWFVISGRSSVGAVLAFVNMLNAIAYPLSELPVAMSSHQKAMAAFARLYELLDEPRERQDGRVFTNGQGVVLEARGLSFSYGEEPVLQDLSLELRRGETVALVGPSGSGKSTVLKVLAGFYPPEGGQVLLYNQPLDKWKLAAARRQMAMVSQDTFLFPGTIAENIALGEPGAEREQIEEAAIQANAHEFICQLPGGYAHILEERGANLSGGQRQRLSLARAILLNAPLLLLDEATSALDTESERLVQDALDKMAASRTTLVVAHRLSTIRNAHRILVLDGGRIVEEGKHQELLDQGGLYRQLYYRQLAAEAEEGGVA